MWFSCQHSHHHLIPAWLLLQYPGPSVPGLVGQWGRPETTPGKKDCYVCRVCSIQRINFSLIIQCSVKWILVFVQDKKMYSPDHGSHQWWAQHHERRGEGWWRETPGSGTHSYFPEDENQFNIILKTQVWDVSYLMGTWFDSKLEITHALY